MKILVAGDWHSELHEQAVYNAFIELGHETLRFAWHEYFKSAGAFSKLIMPFLKAQNKYMFGPLVDRLNHELVDIVAHEQPNLVFVYRGTHIYQKTLQLIHKAAPSAVLVGYNNDDPFSPHYPRWKWRHFLAGVPEYDLVLAYRPHNVDELRAAGARCVELLRSWFIPERNHPVELSDKDRQRFECDVVFVGHYEDDGRLACLEEIVRHGWTLRLFGPGYEWDPVICKSKELKVQMPLELVWGDDYNKALAGAKVALCFFSQLNRDTYTRRCFEIPASGTVLMSVYSDDLAAMFKPDEEAVLFRDIPDLLAKMASLINNEGQIEKIAAAGTKRVWDDGHDVVSRMRDVVGWAGEIERIRE